MNVSWGGGELVPIYIVATEALKMLCSDGCFLMHDFR